MPPIPDLAAKLAQAAILEQKITSQGAALDRLSDTYNQAHQVAVAATLRQADAEAQLAAGQASEAQTVAAIAAGQQALRRAALDAYLDNRPLPQTRSISTSAQAYELGIENVYSSTAVATDAERVRALHAAEAKLRDLGLHMQVVAKQAAADGAAAQAADHKAQVAVDQAIAGQATLLTTLGQIQGDLGVLVAVQQATLAMAAYNQLSQAGTLLFTPSGPLPPELAETAMVISTALAQVGKPYVWGGTGPNVFDCSGLMQWSWAQVGVAMPQGGGRPAGVGDPGTHLPGAARRPGVLRQPRPPCRDVRRQRADGRGAPHRSGRRCRSGLVERPGRLRPGPPIATGSVAQRRVHPSEQLLAGAPAPDVCGDAFGQQRDRHLVGVGGVGGDEAVR